MDERIITTIECRRPNTQKLSAIAIDVRTDLVLAGAGTIKTTTMIGDRMFSAFLRLTQKPS